MKGGVDAGGRLVGAHRLAELHVHRFAVTANTVQHPRLDAGAAHSAGAQLTGAPLWWVVVGEGGGAEIIIDIKDDGGNRKNKRKTLRFQLLHYKTSLTPCSFSTYCLTFFNTWKNSQYVHIYFKKATPNMTTTGNFTQEFKIFQQDSVSPWLAG